MVIQKSESVMNGFFQAFRMEVLRAIQNSFFPTTYFAILITLFLNIYLYTTTDSYVSVAYLLEYSFIGSLTMLFYVWGVLPHGLSYCVDKRSGFLRQIGNRCPVRNYCIAKCCAAFLTSALTMAMSISTFLWLLSFFRPLDNDVYLDASGYRLWYPSHPLFYFIIAATILSLGSGLFSIVALWISSYIQNSFAIMASPLLLYYTQSIIFNKLGLNGLRFLSFSSVFHFTPGFSSPAANFFYTCGYLLTLAVFLDGYLSKAWKRGGSMISIKCGLNTFLKWKGNPKIWVVGLFLIFYVYNLTAPIVKFCKEVNYAVSPWLFPYFFSNPTTLLLFMLAFVLYLCDAPFLDQQQVFVLLRTGRQKWTVGQLLYVAAASFAFFLAIFFLSLIFTWPHLQFMNDWGKIIGTLTQTNAGQSYGIMTLSFNLMNNYAPITAMLLSFTLMCGIGILLGNFMFFVNLWGNRSLGVGGATALVLLPALLHFEGFYKFSYLSPVSWGNLSLMASGLATRLTPPYAYKALLLCNMVLIAAIFTTIHKSDLTVEEVVR